MDAKGNGAKITGAVGGRSGTAQAGAFVAGTQIAGQGGYRGMPPGAQHKDLRGGTGASMQGYTHGPEVVATTGGSKVGTHKDLRGNSGKPHQGFHQGNMK